jgi:hypothetical protein
MINDNHYLEANPGEHQKLELSISSGITIRNNLFKKPEIKKVYKIENVFQNIEAHKKGNVLNTIIIRSGIQNYQV